MIDRAAYIAQRIQLDAFAPPDPANMERQRLRVLALLMDGRWHTVAEMHAVGGTSGDRRMRELRRDGHVIQKRRVSGCDYCEYRLVLP